MAGTVREILQIGDPALRVPAREVTREELASAEVQGLIDDLVATMRAANGAGLAATQIGVPLSVCVIEVGDNPRYPYKPRIPLTILVNPRLEPLTEERFDNYEGCLSVPDLRGIVPRYTRLRVRAWDREGRAHDTVVEGLSAGTFQHECDHLEGLLFVDRVEDPRTLTSWASFDRFHKAAFVERVEALVSKYGQ